MERENLRDNSSSCNFSKSLNLSSECENRREEGKSGTDLSPVDNEMELECVLDWKVLNLNESEVEGLGDDWKVLSVNSSLEDSQAMAVGPTPFNTPVGNNFGASVSLTDKLNTLIRLSHDQVLVDGAMLNRLANLVPGASCSESPSDVLGEAVDLLQFMKSNADPGLFDEFMRIKKKN